MMKVAIMQPYFFPYIGYFSLIKHTNLFILFDSVQFIRHGWIDRNRILKPKEGWQYIRVPLKKYSRDTLIQDIQVNNTQDWKNLIIRQLEHYKKRAPFYEDTVETVVRALDIDTDSIVRLNRNILMTISSYIGIKDTQIDIFSEMNLKIEQVDAPDEWALNICKSLGNVGEYWNPEGGLSFFDRDKYEKEDIDIRFIKMNLTKYRQNRPEFTPGLSIIDVMMFNTPEEINKMLDDYTRL